MEHHGRHRMGRWLPHQEALEDWLEELTVESEGKNPDGMKLSQGYLAHVATRAIILIESDDPVIGLVCLMPVGMVEVSSCVIHPQIRPGIGFRRAKRSDTSSTAARPTA